MHEKIHYYKNDIYLNANSIMKFYLQSHIFTNNLLRLDKSDQCGNYWRDIFYQIYFTV